MKKFLALLTVAIMLISAAGCVTGADSIADETKISKIQIGKTTNKDVEALLGRPGSVEIAESGEQVWTYQRVQTSPLAAIPFLNMMGNSIAENNITIRFNKKGVVKAMARGENRL